MNFDFQRIFDGKEAHRKKLASLPIGEKLRLLDALRERALAIRGNSAETGPSVVREEPQPCQPNRHHE